MLPRHDSFTAFLCVVLATQVAAQDPFTVPKDDTKTKPAYLGPPKMANYRLRKAASSVPRADGICDGDWVPLAGMEDYTRPADSPQIVSELFEGPVNVHIAKTRTQSWGTTLETSPSFEDVLSLGISFSEEFSESLSDSEGDKYHVPEGEEGYVIWTSYVRCSQGSGHCDGNEVSGEVCTPYLDRNLGQLAGVYSVV